MGQEAGGGCGSFQARVCLFLLLVISVGILIVNFPARYDLRNGDEGFYVQSGLALWEGITPTAKYAPAGPQTWISWLYAAGSTARDYLRPRPEERTAPGVIKPFVAANQALFDLYRDWSTLRWIEVVANDLVYLAAVAAAFGLGYKRGGSAPLAGAILVGGMTAALPLFVKLSGEARPYIMAWGFGIIALYFAVGPRRRLTASAIALGFAIGSRVDMLLLFPLVYVDVLRAEGNWRAGVRGAVHYTLIVAMTTLLIAPWLLTNLVGNLRSIATIGLARPKGGWVSLTSTVWDIVGRHGLGVCVVLAAAALVYPTEKGSKLAAVYVLLLACSALKATAWGLQHQGGPVVALVTFSGVGLAAIHGRWPRVVWYFVLLSLLVPAVRTVRDIHERRREYVRNYAVAWIERHVPAGTIVYTSTAMLNPLPTPQSADAIWDEVNHTGAWTLKVTEALKRFHGESNDLPRAFSEEDMIMEKGIRRVWYILGGRTDLPDPRYDIRTFSDSPIYSMNVSEVSAAFKATGGVIICYDANGVMPTDLGTPSIEWVNGEGRGCRIYCSPDMSSRLKDPQDLGAW
jgi:hypothetical protein